MIDRNLSPVFVGHEMYGLAGYGPNHPLGIPRVGPVMALCAALDWLSPGEYRVSPCASEEELGWFQTPDYIRALREASARGKVEIADRTRYAIGTMENPLFPGVFERAATSVGGSLLAAAMALEGRIAYHPAGGTHHGRPDRASGFCYFNDPVFAILKCLRGGVERVLYVDLDAHHGDGVQAAFERDPRVLMISIHEAGRWPHTGAVTDTADGRACNLPVPRGFHDGELGLLIGEVVLPLAAQSNPGVIVLTCGADALAGDPLSSMNLSNAALWSAVTRLADCSPAVVVLGGGGYNPWTVARYWTGLWARLSGRAIPASLPENAQAILRALCCDLIDDDEVRAEWLTTLADPPTDGKIREEIIALREAIRPLVDREAWQSFGVRPAELSRADRVIS
ncbi:MAG: acetoin utilization protein AcuC [Burkholderiales bacterium]